MVGSEEVGLPLVVVLLPLGQGSELLGGHLENTLEVVLAEVGLQGVGWGRGEGQWREPLLEMATVSLVTSFKLIRGGPGVRGGAMEITAVGNGNCVLG